MSTRLLAAVVLALFAIAAGAAGDPVRIGLSAEFGHKTVHLLALAIDRAGATDRAKIRAALENLGSRDGLIRRYAPPLSRARHEALTPDLLFLAHWRADDALVRAGRP